MIKMVHIKAMKSYEFKCSPQNVSVGNIEKKSTSCTETQSKFLFQRIASAYECHDFSQLKSNFVPNVLLLQKGGMALATRVL